MDLEASGTSGMKAVVHGCLNFTTLAAQFNTWRMVQEYTTGYYLTPDED